MSWLDDALPGAAERTNLGEALKHFLTHLHNAVAHGGNAAGVTAEALDRSDEVVGACVANTSPDAPTWPPAPATSDDPAATAPSTTDEGSANVATSGTDGATSGADTQGGAGAEPPPPAVDDPPPPTAA
jgi:hypothetical protein